MSKKEQKAEKTTKAAIDGKPMLSAVPVRLHYWDTEELAAYLCGLDYEDDNIESDDIENALYEKFEISFDSFHKLCEHLLPMVDVGVSPLTKERYKGFSRIDKNGHGFWLLKVAVAGSLAANVLSVAASVGIGSTKVD
jgi:hypothetical protein